uniref:Longitudinals lacking protein, isoform G n=3 Tax=Cacopsylla melanoneura TaxID=428564 RepID=A0A8D8ZRD3_9HEMI
MDMENTNTGGDQHFCLRWNNHQNTLISVFHNLLNSSTLVDCALSAEGKTIQAHKVLLSACSPYFATLLSQHFDKHPIIILKDVKYTELKSMMEYMYRGEVNISQDQLGAFLKAAESLQIKGLTDNSGVNKKISDVASMSDNSSCVEDDLPTQQQPQPQPSVQPRKIDELLSNPPKKCNRNKYTSPPNMYDPASRSPLQNANAITPPVYPSVAHLHPSMFAKKDDRIHGGKRRKLNTPVKNFENVLSPGELVEARMEEGPSPTPISAGAGGFLGNALQQGVVDQIGEDLSRQKQAELFNNNHHHHHHTKSNLVASGPLGSDRENSTERVSAPTSGVPASPVNQSLASSLAEQDAGLNGEPDPGNGPSGEPCDETPQPVSPSHQSQQALSAASLANAEEAAKRKLNELNMEKFAEFQEKMRQILKLNNVTFPGMGEEAAAAGGQAPLPLDFSKFDPSSPAATAFAFAKLNASSGGANMESGGGKFETSAAAVAAFNAAAALRGAASGRGSLGKLDSSQEDMEEEYDNEEEYGEGGKGQGGGDNSVHSDDGLERYRDFLANTDLSSLQDNPGKITPFPRPCLILYLTNP